MSRSEAVEALRSVRSQLEQVVAAVEDLYNEPGYDDRLGFALERLPRAMAFVDESIMALDPLSPESIGRTVGVLTERS